MRPDNIDAASKYIRDIFAKEAPLLKEVAASAPEKLRGMQISPEEGKLLSLFVKMHKVKTIVEIGSFVGYSAIWMARALPEDGHIHLLERNPDHAEIIRKNIEKSGIAEKITLHEGDAMDSLQKLSTNAPFDMVFIDADKPSYLKYLNWAEENIKKDGLIIGDNTFLFGAVYAEEIPEKISPKTLDVMLSFNKRLSNNELYDSILIPTKEGLTVAIKK